MSSRRNEDSLTCENKCKMNWRCFSVSTWEAQHLELDTLCLFQTKKIIGSSRKESLKAVKIIITHRIDRTCAESGDVFDNGATDIAPLLFTTYTSSSTAAERLSAK
ncbi:hypothetical protein KC19_2G108900 [Ceratodon purpureus]|uniref:Uncharacterized protein n=1 Tax=Ceratodon purpureus TaxID=3225 RepID=A0A8T0IV42_CERPU|nr:hypothetical protein KC19_2G108900 [Ceratodon purpureus]